MGKDSKYHFATKAIHAGGAPDEETGAIMPPIFQTSTYVQKSPGKHQGYEYSRSHNPTRTRLEENLASLENAKHALVTASGLSVMTLLLQALPDNSEIISGDDVYGGTYRLFTTVFHERHKFNFIDTTNIKEVKAALSKRPKLIWVETPTNPLLKISDIEKICKIAKEFGVLVVVDNTFMSPYFQNPIELGADFVVHSLTKYINGHSDVIGGAMMTNHSGWYKKLWTLQNSIGPTSAPFDSWLVLRGIKTLALRMEAHQRNAKIIASYLDQHPKIERVIYPGMKSHPQYKMAKKQMSGFGGMITFFIKGGIKESKKFLETVKLFALAESLGGVESLVDHPAIMTHASIPKTVREKLGITDNLIRLSVGVEFIDDLINDLEKALQKV